MLQFTFCKLTCPTGSERGQCRCPRPRDCPLPEKERVQIRTLGDAILKSWDEGMRDVLGLNEREYRGLLQTTHVTEPPVLPLRDIEPCPNCGCRRGFTLMAAALALGAMIYDNLAGLMICDDCRRPQNTGLAALPTFSFPDVSGI